MQIYPDSEHKKILLIRLSAIGDIILTTPLIRALRQRFPAAWIDFITKSKYADLLRFHPAVSQIYEFPDHGGLTDLRTARQWIREQRYDIILDLHRNVRSYALTWRQLHQPVPRLEKFAFRRFLLVKFGINCYREVVPVYRRYLRVAGHLGVQNDGLGTELFIPGEIFAHVDRRLQEAGLAVKRFFAIAPGAGFATKRWPIEYFIELGRNLFQNGQVFCILGDRQDRPLAKQIRQALPEAVDFTGRLSLLDSAAVLSRARALITNDTGLMHMAEAVKTPVVALFGSTTRELSFFPMLPESEVIENPEILCRPCSHVGRHQCPKGHFLCMRSLEPKKVFAVLQQTFGI
ncbi:MAG: lipopolysaccharide heptosyltransferase II [candidate division KSB1 bacterium]|nr:lipopolysaccharide heptosyltransferase II [candidate division KSB1 bacterium]